MYLTNEEFKEKIIDKYLKDINNIYMIQDYIVLETIQDCENMISEISKEDNINNESIKTGVFSYLINNKYLLTIHIISLIDYLIVIY